MKNEESLFAHLNLLYKLFLSVFSILKLTNINVGYPWYFADKIMYNILEKKHGPVKLQKSTNTAGKIKKIK